MVANADELDLPMPDPLPLRREVTYRDAVYRDDVSITEELRVDPGMVTRYLQYECVYKECKHKGVTWGELINSDYSNFADLMSNSVARDSNTFLALKGHLKPADLEFALTSTRHNETEEGKKESQEKFLDLICTHKGSMNGKSWRHIKTNNYSYFMWSIGNTMGRDTKSFKVLVTCLKPEDQTRVITTPKGEVVVTRKQVGVRTPNQPFKTRV